MKLAVFADGTSHPTLKRAAIATVGYDVTDPHHPREIFTHGICVPYCDSTVAEYQAAALALEQVTLRIGHEGLTLEAVTLFTDADAVRAAVDRHRSGKLVRPAGSAVHIEAILRKQQDLARLGCPLTLEVISRKYNKRANHLARQVFLAGDPAHVTKGPVN